jgi:hypothetical protein
MSGIKDFFIGAIDTIDKIAGSDTAKLFSEYESKRRQDKIELAEVKGKRYTQSPIPPAHEQVVREGTSVSESASQVTFNLANVTKYIPYGLALLIPLFFFIKK